MNDYVENAIYGFVSENMTIWPCSFDQDVSDLNLLASDMETILILQGKGIGCTMTSFGITLNESKVLMLATRLAYCNSCGRFTDVRLNGIINTIMESGLKLSPRLFLQTMSEATRFVTSEPDFMRKQRTW